MGLDIPWISQGSDGTRCHDLHQKVILGVKRRVPGIQPKGRWSGCELKTRGELIHCTWPKQRVRSMCLRQSCSLANSCIRHLDLEYDSGFVTTTLQLWFYRQYKRGRGQRKEEKCEHSCCSISQIKLFVQRRVQGKLRATCETDSFFLKRSKAWQISKFHQSPRRKRTTLSIFRQTWVPLLI